MLKKLPGSENVKAFVGTSLLIGACAVPVFGSIGKDTKAGHDLFSQEKPQAMVDSERTLRKDYMETKTKQ